MKTASLVSRSLATCLLVFASFVVQAKDKVTVRIESMQFAPQAITVSVGQKVEWINKDLVPHTVTNEAAFDSKAIPPEGHWTYTPKKKGHFPYKCSFHPTMLGTLEVQ